MYHAETTSLVSFCSYHLFFRSPSSLAPVFCPSPFHPPSVHNTERPASGPIGNQPPFFLLFMLSASIFFIYFPRPQHSASTEKTIKTNLRVLATTTAKCIRSLAIDVQDSFVLFLLSKTHMWNRPVLKHKTFIHEQFTRVGLKGWRCSSVDGTKQN